MDQRLYQPRILSSGSAQPCAFAASGVKHGSGWAAAYQGDKECGWMDSIHHTLEHCFIVLEFLVIRVLWLRLRDYSQSNLTEEAQAVAPRCHASAPTWNELSFLYLEFLSRHCSIGCPSSPRRPGLVHRPLCPPAPHRQGMATGSILIIRPRLISQAWWQLCQ